MSGLKAAAIMRDNRDRFETNSSVVHKSGLAAGFFVVVWSIPQEIQAQSVAPRLGTTGPIGVALSKSNWVKGVVHEQ